MENGQERLQPKNASWGAIISILVIIAMIVIGAFYSWEKRIKEERLGQPATTTSISAASTQNQ